MTAGSTPAAPARIIDIMEWLIHNLRKVILSIIAAVVLWLITKNYAKIKKFIIEVQTELKKVSWSTRQELISATFVVIVITGMLTLFIGAVDFVFSKALSLMIR